MRAPVMRPFLVELDAYSKAVLDGAPAGPERDLISGVLSRWRDHGDAEKTWNTIVEAAIAAGNMSPPPRLFIAWIVQARLYYWRLADRVSRTPELLRRLRAQSDKDWKAGNIDRAYIKRAGAESYAHHADVILGRKKVAAPQQRFMRMLRDTFIENCGKPLDGSVATLTGIAFDEVVSTDDVKWAAGKAKRRRSSKS